MVSDNEKLIKFIIENSESSNLEDALLDWIPINHNPRFRDNNIGYWYYLPGSHCVCGHEIKRCYQIKNISSDFVFPKTKNSSVAIGSECIKKFTDKYKFSTYEHKTQLCITCNKSYKGNCSRCQKKMLSGITYCINLEYNYKINENTKKKYGNKKCRKCNKASL